MTVKKTKYRVMAATIPIVQYDDRGIEIGRSYFDQGKEIELDANDVHIKRYVELGAILDIKAANEKEAADRKAEAAVLLQMAEDAQARAAALEEEAANVGKQPSEDDLPPEQKKQTEPPKGAETAAAGTGPSTKNPSPVQAQTPPPTK
jgi:hypothetical protein